MKGLKHHFASLKNDLISWDLVVLERKLSWNCFENNSIFFSFVTHFKSYSATTTRELLQQFATCSGWRWQSKFRLERVNSLMSRILICLNELRQPTSKADPSTARVNPWSAGIVWTFFKHVFFKYNLFQISYFKHVKDKKCVTSISNFSKSLSQTSSNLNFIQLNTN